MVWLLGHGVNASFDRAIDVAGIVLDVAVASQGVGAYADAVVVLIKRDHGVAERDRSGAAAG